jgi:hypothetical protein
MTDALAQCRNGAAGPPSDGGDKLVLGPIVALGNATIEKLLETVFSTWSVLRL